MLLKYKFESKRHLFATIFNLKIISYLSVIVVLREFLKFRGSGNPIIK